MCVVLDMLGFFFVNRKIHSSINVPMLSAFLTRELQYEDFLGAELALAKLLSIPKAFYLYMYDVSADR